jgi:hypothetical protein
MKLILLCISHIFLGVTGFVLGVYTLPILVEPEGLSAAEMAIQANSATFTGGLTRNLRGSDALHWGEGRVYLGPQGVALDGKVTPGPDYKLYLSPEFVETKDQFELAKARMVRIGDVRAFHNFLLPVPNGVDVTRFNTVVIWCETFHQFVSSAKYR